MAGRRKRAVSDSSVETIDLQNTNYVNETVVMKAVDPKTKEDTDSWPCFVLKEAQIYHADGRLANQLQTDLEGPFVIRGRVELDRDQQRYLKNRAYKNRELWIQIYPSSAYSIGLTPDALPIPVLWASGEAGWWEIVPAVSYQNIADSMSAAINLYYSVYDSYITELERLHKSKKHRKKELQDVQMDLDQVLAEYAMKAGDGCTLQEAQQRCDKDAPFLLSHFPSGTQFHTWVSERNPDIVRKMSKKSSKPRRTPVLKAAESMTPPPATKPGSVELAVENRNSRAALRNSIQQYSHDSNNAEGNVGSRPGRTRQSRDPGPSHTNTSALPETPRPEPGSSKVWSHESPSRETALSAVLSVLEEKREEMLDAKKKHPDACAPSTWHNQVYLKCRVKHSHGGREVCEYFARDLVEQLGPEWRTSLLYKWALENVNTKPAFELISEDEIVNLVKRQKKPVGPTFTISGKQPHTPQGKKPPTRPRPQTSALRPSLGGKKRTRGDDESDDEMDVDGPAHLNASKKPRFPAEGSDDSSASQSEQDDDMDEQFTELVIRADKLPSTKPKGPNSTWTCEVSGCGHVVRDANGDEGQGLVNDHLDEHDKAAQEEEEARGEAEEAAQRRVNLAIQESQGNMPINHLLDKIRNLGGGHNDTQQSTSNGTTQSNQPPQPIKRALLW